MAAISTKNAEVWVDGESLLATKWTLEIKADEIDITTFESGGFTDYLTSYVDAHISVDAFWDQAADPFANAPHINVGNVVTIRLYTHRGDPSFFNFPEAIITGINTTAAVRDAVRYDFTARNKGTFSYTDGTAYTGTEEIFPIIE